MLVLAEEEQNFYPTIIITNILFKMDYNNFIINKISTKLLNSKFFKEFKDKPIELLDIQQAQDYPRFFPDPFSDVIDIEEAVPEKICAALRAKGHKIRRARVPVGGSQAIWIDEQTGMLIAGSDPRKDGMAAGY